MRKTISLLLVSVFFIFFNAESQVSKKKNKTKKIKETTIEQSQIKEQQTPQTENRPNRDESLKKPESAKFSSTQVQITPNDIENIINQSKPIVTQKPNGSINWTEQYIEAKGRSVIDNQRFTNPAQAKLMAQRGAIVDAQRNLLEIIKGVNITSETTVQDMITTRDYIYTRLDGIIKGAQQIGEPVEKEGFIEVTLRVPIYSKDGLAPVFYNEIEKTKKSITVSDIVNEIPQEVKDQVLNGIVFNMGGKRFDPSMFPIVVDENGNLIFDFSKIYDLNSGKFPKIVQTTEELLKEFGFKKGVEILNVIKAENGKITIDTPSAKKVNWQKIGDTAAKIGKFLLMLI
ncbi:MAG: hypothetical protein N3A01_07020 [Bacteroidales bacterium]|nr:hypothetical protein [Bacteroidales bacterium]